MIYADHNSSLSHWPRVLFFCPFHAAAARLLAFISQPRFYDSDCQKMVIKSAQNQFETLQKFLILSSNRENHPELLAVSDRVPSGAVPGNLHVFRTKRRFYSRLPPWQKAGKFQWWSSVWRLWRILWETLKLMRFLLAPLAFTKLWKSWPSGNQFERNTTPLNSAELTSECEAAMKI